MTLGESLVIFLVLYLPLNSHLAPAVYCIQAGSASVVRRQAASVMNERVGC